MKKSTKKILIIIPVLVIFLIILISVIHINSFSVKQIKSNIELGSEQSNMKTYFSYDKDSFVDILGNKTIDTNKLGSYKVSVEETNKYHKTKKFAFVFNVVDTQAPNLKEVKKIYMASGNKFEPKNYLNVTDADNKLEYSFEGELNTDKVGEYPIEITVKDSSNNKSTISTIIVVENRKNLTFRNTKWGDSKDTVQRYESAEYVGNAGDDNYLMYSTKLNSKEVNLIYTFQNDKLVEGAYMLSNDEETYYKIQYYDDIKEILTKKYGKPSRDKINIINSLAEYASDDAMAIDLGYLSYTALWNTKDSDIYIALMKGEDGVGFILNYSKKGYESKSNDLI